MLQCKMRSGFMPHIEYVNYKITSWTSGNRRKWYYQTSTNEISSFFSRIHVHGYCWMSKTWQKLWWSYISWKNKQDIYNKKNANQKFSDDVHINSEIRSGKLRKFCVSNMICGNLKEIVRDTYEIEE